MSLKPGRNDPCPCGSGTKYKKCHLAQDQAREQAALVEQAVRVAQAGRSESVEARDATSLLLIDPSRIPELTPEEQEEYARWEAHWQAFNDAGYDQQLRMYEDLLAAGDLDDEAAFEMLATLHERAIEHDQRDRFRGLVEALRERAPDRYAHDLIWYLSWLIEDAVAEREYHRLPALAVPLADTVHDNIDEVFRLIDVLLFHDQAGPLVEMMRRAWPAVSTSSDFLPTTVSEFAMVLSMLTVYQHLERGRETLADASLHAALAPVREFNPALLRRMIDALTGAAPRDWRPDDFVCPATDGAAGPDARGPAATEEQDGHRLTWPLSRDEGDEDADALTLAQAEAWRRLAENVMVLLLEWTGWVRREYAVPFARVEMVRDTLLHYLLERPPDKEGRLRLLPDRRSFEGRLAALMSVLSGQHYKAGALFALVPTYIDMLAARGLVKRDAARRARSDILSLRPHVQRIVEESTDDPALHEAIMRAGESG